MSMAPSSLQKSGAQGRIRTFVAHNAADLQSAAINHSATCASGLLIAPSAASPPTMQFPARDLPAQLPAKIVDGEHCKRVKTGRYNQTHRAVGRNWSWRRDLNPRPPDYKSGALPAELRQPTQHAYVREPHKRMYRLYHRPGPRKTPTCSTNWTPSSGRAAACPA